MLYTNHATAKYIAANRDRFPILSRLPLWYARYKPGIRNVFPMGNWDSYALWQFSSAANCSKRRCPYRVAGTLTDIDVNVAAMNAKALKAVWAKGELLPAKPLDKPLLIATGKGSVSAGAGIGVDSDVDGVNPQGFQRPGFEVKQRRTTTFGSNAFSVGIEIRPDAIPVYSLADNGSKNGPRPTHLMSR